MRRPILLLVALVLTAGTAHRAGAEDAVDPKRHGYWPVRVQSLDEIRWTLATDKYLGMAVPTPAGDLVIQERGGTLQALDPQTGMARWTARGDAPYDNHSSCTVGPDGTVYGGTFDEVRAVDADGTERWRTQLQCRWLHGPPSVSPDGATLYVGGDDLGIAALDAKTGAVDWLRRDFVSSWNDYVHPEEGGVIVATRAGLFAFAEDGRERWSLPDVLEKPMLVGDLLVAADRQGLRALRLDTRETVWTWASGPGQKVVGLAYGDNDRIVAALLGGELACLEPTGHLRWRKRLSPTALYRIAAVKGGETLVADAQGVLRLVDDNGAVISSIATKDQPWRWRPSVDGEGRIYLGHRRRLVCIGGAKRPPARPVVASALTLVADDFVVDVWHNGTKLGLDQRHMLAEIHGATSERVSVDVREGDWLVFHVVANRLRWNGASYFGLHATAPDGREAFVSRVNDAWVACDEPADVAAFVANPWAGQDRGVKAPAHPWSDAPRIWRDLLGRPFEGEPVWGEAPSTWIKVVVGPPLPPMPPPPTPPTKALAAPEPAVPEHVLAIVEERCGAAGAHLCGRIVVKTDGTYAWTRHPAPADAGTDAVTIRGRLPADVLEPLQLGFAGRDPRVVVRIDEIGVFVRRGVRRLRTYLRAVHDDVPPPPGQREVKPPPPPR